MDTVVCFLFASLWGIYIIYIYICLFVFPVGISDLLFFLSRHPYWQTNIYYSISFLWIRRAATVCSNAQNNPFFSPHIIGEGKKKHRKPWWVIRQGNSVYTKCSVAALELHSACFWELNLSFQDFVYQSIQLQAWIVAFPSGQLAEII